MRERRTVTRLYLGGNPARDSVTDWLADHDIKGATLYPATGIWKGGQENTIIIEIVGLTEQAARNLKQQAEQDYQQDSVMLLHTQAAVSF